MKKAAGSLNMSVESVRLCCNGKLSSCGYEVRFLQDIDLPGEVWVDAVCPRTRKILPGYLVSSCGRIQGPTAIRTFGRSANGYLRIWHQGKNLPIHRIMACSFLEVPTSRIAQWEVNHKDANKSNNCISNLEVATRSENLLHAWGMRVSSKRRPVDACHMATGGICRTFASVTKAVEHVSCSKSTGIIATGFGIIACCKGRTKSFCGYKWRYSTTRDAESRPDKIWKDVDLLALSAAWNLDGGSTPVQSEANQTLQSKK